MNPATARADRRAFGARGSPPTLDGEIRHPLPSGRGGVGGGDGSAGAGTRSPRTGRVGVLLVVEVHLLTGDPTGPFLPEEGLRALFRTIGVDVEFVDGEPFGQFGGPWDDPAGEPSSLGVYRRIAENFAGPSPRVGDPAHLFVGRHFERQGVLGSLLHPLHGAAAVFKLPMSGVPGMEEEDAMMQTCAHELGHVLNQVHEDGVEERATAMCQTSARVASLDWVLDAWRHQGWTLPLGVWCFPFSRATEAEIADHPDAVVPWGSAYAGGNLVDDRHGPERRRGGRPRRRNP